MAAAYPSALKSFTPLVNGVDEILAEHHNDAYLEITALETELGTLPKGSFANVKTRLAALQPATLAGATKLVLDADGDTILDVTADDVLRLALAADGRLAVGQTGLPAPDCLLHLWKATAGAVTAPSGALLTIENSDSAAIAILTPANKIGTLYFGSPTSNARAYIAYLHAADTMRFNVKGVTQLDWSDGSFALQKETTISTAAGGIKLAPFDGYVTLTGILSMLGSKTIDMAGGAIDRLAFLHGPQDADMYIDANTTETAPTERGITMRTLDADADAWVTIARFTPNGANPTLVMSKLIDLSPIGAGNPLLKIVATSDAPTAAWDTEGAAYKVTTAPAGWLEVLVGADTRYIPYWS